MSEAIDYFANHRLKLRFPWRLYHAAIVRAAAKACGAEDVREILNVGSGPFLELPELPLNDRRYTACDLDPRAVTAARALHGSRLDSVDVVEPDSPLPYAEASFDLVLSMDVIEHLALPTPWLSELMRVVRPGGRLFLTTPNYGSFTLKLLERTILEGIARTQGFTRRGLHPTQLDRKALSMLLDAAGAQDVRIDLISFGWVLAATARRPLTT